MSDFAANLHFVHLLVASLRRADDPWRDEYREKITRQTRVTSRDTQVKALQRLFSTFPGSWPGVALLLLRVIVGVTALAQGVSYLSRGDRWTTAALLSGLLLVISGACLLIGFLTPIVSVLAGLACIASTISLLPPPPANLFDGALVSLDMAVMAVAVALLGPGAFSLDARLFGRREIVIPSSPRESKS